MAVGPDGYFELCEDIRLDLLELYGRGYVIDHCIAALKRKNEAKIKEIRLNAYITDALKIIAENTSHFLLPGHGAIDYGSTLSKRWIELESPEEKEKLTKPSAEEDTRSCTEFAADVWKRIRGEDNVDK